MTREEKKIAGICTYGSCDDPQSETSLYCERHRRARNERQNLKAKTREDVRIKKRAAWVIWAKNRVATGKCLRCNEPRINARWCLFHRVKMNVEYQRERKARMRQ